MRERGDRDRVCICKSVKRWPECFLQLQMCKLIEYGVLEK